jgi:hypothetical protein
MRVLIPLTNPLWPQFEATRLHPGYIDCCREDCTACQVYREAEEQIRKEDREWLEKYIDPDR